MPIAGACLYCTSFLSSFIAVECALARYCLEPSLCKPADVPLRVRKRERAPAVRGLSQATAGRQFAFAPALAVLHEARLPLEHAALAQLRGCVVDGRRAGQVATDGGCQKQSRESDDHAAVQYSEMRSGQTFKGRLLIAG